MSANNYTTTGSLNYMFLPTDGSRPYINRFAVSLTDGHIRNWDQDTHIVDIENIRGSEDQYKLDDAAFQFGRQASKHTSFLDDKEVEAEYYPECIDIIKKVTRASRAVIFDHTIRRRQPGEVDPQQRQPVSHVHGDQTKASSIARIHTYLPASEVPALLQRRFQIINLWRPISHTALDWPLALCDFRSVDVENDLLSVRIIDPVQEREAIGVKFNEAHKWKYMRGMEPDEFILIKCFDSDATVATFTPHTAFEDPNTPGGVPHRESIEIHFTFGQDAFVSIQLVMDLIYSTKPQMHTYVQLQLLCVEDRST